MTLALRAASRSPTVPGAYSYIISKEGSTYFARDHVGRVVTSGTDAATVVQAVHDAASAGARVHFAEGTYDFGAGVAPFTATKALALTGVGDGSVIQYTGAPGSDGYAIQVTGVTGFTVTSLRFTGDANVRNHSLRFTSCVRPVVQDCSFSNVGDEAITFQACSRFAAWDNHFDTCPSADAGGACIVTQNDSFMGEYRGNEAVGGVGAHYKIEAVTGVTPPKRIAILNNRSRQAGLHGVHVGANGDQDILNILIKGNMLDEPTDRGVYIDGGATNCPRRVGIYENVIVGGGTSAGSSSAIEGESLTADALVVARGNIVVGYGSGTINKRGISGINHARQNQVYGVGDDGIRGILADGLIEGNECADNGGAHAGTRAGIVVGNNNCVVIGNRCWETRAGAARTQQQGVRIQSGVTGTFVFMNRLSNNVANQLQDLGTGTTKALNAGVTAPAYTRTYDTQSRTHPVLTSQDIGPFTGGVVGFLDAAERDNIRTQVNAHRIDLENVKKVIAAMIADDITAGTKS